MTANDPPPAAADDDNRVPFGDPEDREFMGLPEKSPLVSAPTQVAVYAEFVKELLENAEKRKAAMETRAVAVVTASGTLVTLLLALAALETRLQKFHVPGTAKVFAALSAVAFIAAGLLAMLANTTWKGWGLRPEHLTEQLWERWGREQPPDDPVQKTTATRLKIWESVHRHTQRAGWLLFAATACQALALLLLGVAVVIILA